MRVWVRRRTVEGAVIRTPSMRCDQVCEGSPRSSTKRRLRQKDTTEMPIGPPLTQGSPEPKYAAKSPLRLIRAHDIKSSNERTISKRLRPLPVCEQS